MLKRLNMVIAVLMTVSMLIVPLAAAGQSPVTSSDAAQADTQPVSAAAQDTAPPAPQLVHAPPTGQDPLPPMEESIEVPFDLIYVIRSCEDQTRFDLEWEGNGTIETIKYVLFNSSDNSSTEGEIDGTNGFGTAAAIWGKPGDTAMSVDVLLLTGEEFSYLANASVCDVSKISVPGEQIGQSTNSTTATQSQANAAVEGTNLGRLNVTLETGHPDVLLSGVTVELYDMTNSLIQTGITDEAGVVAFVDVPEGAYEILPLVDAPFDQIRSTVEVSPETASSKTVYVTHSRGSFHTISYQPPSEVTQGFVTFSLVNSSSGVDQQYTLAVGEQMVLPLAAGTYEFNAFATGANNILQFSDSVWTIAYVDNAFEIVPNVVPSGSLEVTIETSGITFVPAYIEIELLVNGQVVQTGYTNETGIATFDLVEARPDYTARVYSVGSFPDYTTAEFTVYADTENTYTLNWANSEPGETVTFTINLEAVADDQWFQFAVYDESTNHINTYTFLESGTFTQIMQLPEGSYTFHTYGDRYYTVSGVPFEVLAGETNEVTITPEVRPWETVTFVVDLQAEGSSGYYYLTLYDEDGYGFHTFTFYSSGLYYQTASLPVGMYTYSTSFSGNWGWYEPISDFQFEVTEGGENTFSITPTLNPTATLALEINLNAESEDQWARVYFYDQNESLTQVIYFQGMDTHSRTLTIPAGSYSYYVTGSPYGSMSDGSFELEAGETLSLPINPQVIGQEIVAFNVDLQSELEYQWWYLVVYDMDGYERGSINLNSAGTHVETLPLPPGQYTYRTESDGYETVWDVPLEVTEGGTNEVVIAPVPEDQPVRETGTVTFIVDLEYAEEASEYRVVVKDEYRNGRGSFSIYESGVSTHSFELPVGSYTYDGFGTPYLANYDNPLEIKANQETIISLTPARAPMEAVTFTIDLQLDVENQYLDVSVSDRYGNWFGSVGFDETGPHAQTINLPVGEYTYSIFGTPYKRVEGVPFEVKSGEANHIEIVPTPLSWGVVTFNATLNQTSSSYHFFYVNINDEEGYYAASPSWNDPGTYVTKLALRPGIYTYSGYGYPYLPVASTTFEVVAGDENVINISPATPAYAEVIVRGNVPNGEYLTIQIYSPTAGRVAYDYSYGEDFSFNLPEGSYTLTARVGSYSNSGNYAEQEIEFTVTAAGPNLVEFNQFQLNPSVTFSVVDQNAVPVEEAEITIRNEWDSYVRTVYLYDSGTVLTHLPLGEYTYSITAPSKYQIHAGGSFIHNADEDQVEIVLTELPNSNLTVTFGFQNVPDRPSSAELLDSSGTVITSFAVPQIADSAFIPGVPHGDGYTVRLIGSNWYPEQVSQPFSASGTGPNLVMFHLTAMELVQVIFEFTPETGRELPQSPQLNVSGSEESGVYEWVYLYRDTDGVYRASITLPAGSYLVEPSWADGGYLTMQPFTMQLIGGPSSFTQVLNIDVAAYGSVIFELAPIAPLLHPNMGDTILISQDGTVANEAYISWESGAPTTWPVNMKPGSYQWTLQSSSAANGLSGEFTVADGDISIRVEGQPASNGVVVVQTTFPDGVESTTVGGSVTLRPSTGDGPAFTRYLNNLSEVAIGPVPYGDYIVSIESNDPRFAFIGTESVTVSSGEQQLSIEWTPTGASPIETHQYTVILHGSDDGAAPVNARVYVSNPNSPNGTNFYADENGIVVITVTDIHLNQWYAYAYAENYDSIEIIKPTTANIAVSFQDPKSRIAVSVVDEQGQPLAGMYVRLTCNYGAGGVTDESGMALIYDMVLENSRCAAGAADPTRGYVPVYDTVPFRWKSATSPSVTVTMKESETAVHNVQLSITNQGEPITEGQEIAIVSDIDGSTLFMHTDANGIVTILAMQPGSYSVHIPLLVDNQLPWGDSIIARNVYKTINVETSDQQIILDVTGNDYSTITFNVVTSDGSPIPEGLTLRAVIYGRYSDSYSDPIAITGEPITINMAPGSYNLVINDSARYRGITYRFVAQGDSEVTLMLQRIAAVDAPILSLSAPSGQAGTTTTVNGTGFKPAETVTLRWDGPAGTKLGTVDTEDDGSFSLEITVPVIATKDTYNIVAVGSAGSKSSTNYKVTQLAEVNVNLTPASGRAGTVTSVSGSGFQPGETVTIRWGGASGRVLGAVKATARGTFSGKVTVPAIATVGTYSIHATGGTSNQTGSASYQVTSLAVVKVNLSITTGRAGSITAVMGSGFQPGETVTIRWGSANGTVLGAVKATASGTFSGKVTVPAIATVDTYTIHVTGGFSNQIGSASYQVTSLAVVKVNLSPASGRAGTVTSVSGSGYQPGETVTIRWNSASGTVLGAVKATATGTFSGKVTVPAIATGGTYTIHATGGSSKQTASADYQVTALAVVKVNLSITTGRAGSITAVMGSGFQPGETVTIRWGSANGQSLGSVKVSPSGTISGKVTVPPIASVGTFSIHASGGTSKQTGSATYRVSALAVVKVNLSITTGRAGSITAVMGSGFQPGETVTIRWGNATGPVLGAVKASPTGTISGKVTIPRIAQLGTFNIHVSGSTSKQVGTAKYTVNRLVMATIRLSPASGRAGTIISVSGTGYRPGEVVTIRWGGASGPVMGSVKASSAGTFSGKVVVPKNAAKRTYAVHVSGGTSKQVSVTPFIVTQLAASAPGRQDVAKGWITIHL